MRRMIQKLRGTAGETIAETLIGLLIAAFALITLAGMISAANNAVKRSEEIMGSYYTANAELENGTSTMSMQFSGGDTGYSLSPVGVSYAENNTFSGNPVIAYRTSTG